MTQEREGRKMSRSEDVSDNQVKSHQQNHARNTHDNHQGQSNRLPDAPAFSTPLINPDRSGLGHNHPRPSSTRQSTIDPPTRVPSGPRPFVPPSHQQQQPPQLQLPQSSSAQPPSESPTSYSQPHPSTNRHTVDQPTGLPFPQEQPSHENDGRQYQNYRSGQSNGHESSDAQPRGRIDSFFGLEPGGERPISTSHKSPQPSPPRQFPEDLANTQNQHNSLQYQNQYQRPSSFFGLDTLQPSSDPNNNYLSPDRTSPGSSNLSHQEHHRSSQAILRQAKTNSLFIRHSQSFNRRQSAEYDGLSASAQALANGPLLDHSHLKPGGQAKLLNHAKTLELYRANAKKTNDPEVMFEFACFLMDVVKEISVEEEDDRKSSDKSQSSHSEEQHKRRSIFNPATSKIGSGNQSDRDREKASLTQEAIALLQRLANRGHVQSQYLLADCYTKAIGTQAGSDPSPLPPGDPMSGGKVSKQDYDRAFPLFVLAAKHGHIEAMYRAGQCCEHGWGTRKERDKALQFYRKAAIAQYPLAMHRLGLADLNGDLGQPRRPKDGVKWLKRAAEAADESNPKPLHELALLHEKGIEHVVFVDYDYAVELLARAAELGYAPSAYKLGECYEYGRMGCPQDAALSIHYYNIAAQQNHKEACFALTAWYLVGSVGVLPQSDTEAYLWAKKAAEAGLAKAEYAVGYFTEVGIGTKRDEREAMNWFRKAAEHGDKRARDRLRKDSNQAAVHNNRLSTHPGQGGKQNGSSKKVMERRRGELELSRSSSSSDNNNKKNKEDCIVM